MASPVRASNHGEPDNLMQTWLGTYAAAHPDVRAATNTTLQLGPDDTPQPAALLSRVRGARAADAQGYLAGPPGLVVQIASSSVSRDAREKLVTYRRARIPEYLLWRVEEEAIDWFRLEEDEYRTLVPGDGGFLASSEFPGLRLDVSAALRLDAAAVLAGLRPV